MQAAANSMLPFCKLFGITALAISEILTHGPKVDSCIPNGYRPVMNLTYLMHGPTKLRFMQV